jgi:hypothetical protein
LFHVRSPSLLHPMDNQGEFFPEVLLALVNSGILSIKNTVISSVQMHQHITIIISIANGSLSSLLMCLVALSSFSQVGTLTPTILQQFFSKGHWKNICHSFSSDWNKPNSQSYESRCIFFFLEASLLYLVYFSKITKRRPYAFVDTRRTKAI